MTLPNPSDSSADSLDIVAMSHSFAMPRQEDNPAPQDFGFVPRDVHALVRQAFSVDGSAIDFGGAETPASMAFAPFYQPQMVPSAFSQATTATSLSGPDLGYTFYRFLEQNKLDDPFVVPANLTGSSAGGQLGSCTGYRNPPSEFGNALRGLLSDSGYGTGHQSLGNPSIYGDLDHNHETRSLIGHMCQFNFAEPANSQPQQHPPPPPPPPPHPPQQHMPPGSTTPTQAGNFICPDCNAVVKTRSDLRKHEQRHYKRHACTVPGCSRVDQPFSTVNDLDRHRKSVHRANVPGPRYRCSISDCSHSQKIWPRADNFRQHLRRIHKMELSANQDLKQFQVRETSPPPPRSHPSPADPPPVQEHTLAATLQGTPKAADRLKSPPSPPPPPLPPSRNVCGPQAPYDAIEPSDHIWPALDPVAPDAEPASEAEVDCLEEQSHLITPELAHHMTKTLQALKERPPYRMEEAVVASTGASSFASASVCSSLGDDGMSIYDEQIGIQNQQPQQQPPELGYGRDAGPPAFHGSLSTAIELDPDGTSIASLQEFIRLQGVFGPDLLSVPMQEHFNSGTLEFVCEEQDKSDASDGNIDCASDQEDASLSDTDSEDDDDESSASSSASRSQDVPMSDTGQDSAVGSESLLDAEGRTEDGEAATDSTLARKIEFPSTETDWADEAERSRLFDFLATIPKPVMDMFILRMGDAGSAAESGHDSLQYGGGSFGCKDCSKVFSRLCDLKKHAKRHEKPYCCTFPPCPKKFGSKNDWKRHETGQHLDARTWTCAEPLPAPAGAPPLPCAMVFTQRSAFRTHLQNVHGARRIDERLEACASSGIEHLDSWHWCGFCRDNVPVKEGKSIFLERFDHIDDHFFGRNNLARRSIDEWSPCPTPTAGPTATVAAGGVAARKRVRSSEGCMEPPPPPVKRAKLDPVGR